MLKTIVSFVHTIYDHDTLATRGVMYLIVISVMIYIIIYNSTLYYTLYIKTKMVQ